jgi:hypothetical protein
MFASNGLITPPCGVPFPSLSLSVLFNNKTGALSHLLSENNKQDFLTIVEINRQFGQFEKCRELLNKNLEESFKDLKTLYLNEVKKKNTILFRLN